MKKNSNKNLSKNIINVIIILMAATSLVVMAISIKNIYEWKIDNDKTKKQVSELQEKTEIKEEVVDNNAENVEVKQDEDGNTELKADGETVAEEEKTETPEDTTEEPLGEPAELSEDEMKKLEEEMKAEGLV